METWLLDSGPLIAYLDRNDSAHHEVVSRLDGFKGHLVTTSAVIHEAMFMVAMDQSGPRLLSDFLCESDIPVYDLSHPLELREASKLMEDYHEVPMDYADATLVLLADGLSLRDILTLNRQGFSVFRTKRRRPLRLVLD